MGRYVGIYKIEMSSITNLVCDPLNFQRKIDKKQDILDAATTNISNNSGNTD
jgi:hypothetical protein